MSAVRTMSFKLKANLVVFCCYFLVMALASEIIGESDDAISNNFATKLLELVEQYDFPSSPEKERLLILGETGCGSSFVSCVLANDSTLKAVRSGWDLNITDQNGRVSTGPVTESNTMVPDLLVDKDGHSYYDLPGFRNTRGGLYDILASYSIKEVIRQSKGVKVAFVIGLIDNTYTEIYRELSELAVGATQMFENFENYSGSAMLIANKILQRRRGNKTESDQEYVAGLVERFDYIKQEIFREIEQESLPPNTKDRYMRIIRFIDFVTGDNGNRIAVVHLVDDEGFVNEMPPFIESRSHIRKIINEDLEFFPEDFKNVNPSISPRSNESLSQIQDNIRKHLEGIVGEIAQYFKNMTLSIVEKQTGDLGQLIETLRDLYNASQRVNDIDYNNETLTPNSFVKELYSAVEDYKEKKIPAIMSQAFMSDKIFNIIKIINAEFSELFNQLQRYWNEKIKFLKLAKEWYEFLYSLDEVLNQRTQGIIADELIDECDKIVIEGPVRENLPQLEPFLRSIDQNELYEKIRDSTVTYHQAQVLKEILEKHRVNRLN